MTSSWLLLGERRALGELAGGVLLVAGAFVALRPARRTPVQSRAATPPTPVESVPS